MTQAELERELASVTGESVSTIRNRGFQLVEPPTLSPLTIDWDELDRHRVSFLPQRSREKRRQAA